MPGNCSSFEPHRQRSRPSQAVEPIRTLIVTRRSQQSAFLSPTSPDWTAFEHFVFVRVAVCTALTIALWLAARYGDAAAVPTLRQIVGLVIAGAVFGILFDVLARVYPAWLMSARHFVYLRHTIDVLLTTIGASLIHDSNAFVPVALYALIVTDTAVKVSSRAATMMAAVASAAYGCVTLFVDTTSNPDVLPPGSLPKVIFSTIILSALAAQTAILIDATRRERVRSDALFAAKEAVRRSEQRFRALIENSSDLVAILGPDGTVRYASPSHRAVLGYEAEDLVGRNVFDLVHPEDRFEVLQRFAEGMQSPGASETAEFRFRHKDGSWRTLEGIATNRIDDAAIRGAVVNSRDVTDRRRAERQLGAQAIELGRKQGELEAFVYTITHDLKNPVNAIVLLADLMLERGGLVADSEERCDLERILRLAATTEHMLRDLLGFFRVTSVSEQPECVDLGALAVDVVNDLCPQIAGKGIRVDIGALPIVWGQRAKLRHVVANLVSNAIKYVPSRYGEVVLFGRNGGESAFFTVDDNGIGVPKLHRERVFEIFGRVPPDQQYVDGQPVEGTGVGLAIVKRIVEAHGGSVAVCGRPGGGSRFTVRLPARPPAETA